MNKQATQVLESKWRRVPESNRCTRICNPSGSVEKKAYFCKRTLFVHALISRGYKASVNPFAFRAGQRKTVEGAATHLNGTRKFFYIGSYQTLPLAAISGGGHV